MEGRRPEREPELREWEDGVELEDGAEPEDGAEGQRGVPLTF